MSDKFPTLSGFWTGVYDYVGAAQPVAFNAMLTESAGQVTGESIEPNTFADPSVSELFSSLSGIREGEQVQFVKTYEGAPGAGHSVRYIGVVDAKLTKIEGRWSISGMFGSGGSGPFVMNRRGAQAAAEHRAHSSEDLDAPR